MPQDFDFLIPISSFVMVVLMSFFSAKYNYLTKKAIIEKGGNIDFPKKKFPILEFGSTFLGIGLGLAFSVIPESLNISEDAKSLLVAACILLFGGAGMVTAFFVRKKIDAKK